MNPHIELYKGDILQKTFKIIFVLRSQLFDRVTSKQQLRCMYQKSLPKTSIFRELRQMRIKVLRTQEYNNRNGPETIRSWPTSNYAKTTSVNSIFINVSFINLSM